MTYYAYKPVAVLTYCFMASVAFSFPAQARTTFLPDFEEEPMKFVPDCEGGGEDYCLCERSTNPKYYLVPGFPKCTKPKIFDKTCPHSDDWITECYCPASYNQTCTSPYRGVGLICDGKYEECCDTRCREGSTSGCSYPYVTDYTSSTGCGETCYVCRYGNDCNTSCSAGEEASYSGGYNDFNGGACVTCSTPPPPEPECTPYEDESGCNCYSCSDGCGGTRQCCGSCYTPDPDPEPEEPDIPDIPDPEPEPDTDPCAGKSSISCKFGCASYDSQCSNICTSCKDNPDCDISSMNCPYGCAQENSCGRCVSCNDDPCKGVSCPTAVSCGLMQTCSDYSTATSCCSSVCTACESAGIFQCPGGNPGSYCECGGRHSSYALAHYCRG